MNNSYPRIIIQSFHGILLRALHKLYSLYMAWKIVILTMHEISAYSVTLYTRAL